MSDAWAAAYDRLCLRDEHEMRHREFFATFLQLAHVTPAAADVSVRELELLREENDVLVLRLNTQTLRLEASERARGAAEMKVEDEKARSAKLRARVGRLQEELAEKARAYAALTDEHLVTQMQQRVLGERLAAMEKGETERK